MDLSSFSKTSVEYVYYVFLNMFNKVLNWKLDFESILK